MQNKKKHHLEMNGRIQKYMQCFIQPIGSMYGIFTYIYHKNQPNVGKYTIHGWYGARFITSHWFLCDKALLFARSTNA